MSTKKVLFLGSGRGGKSSIIKIIFNNYMPCETSQLAPTLEKETSSYSLFSNHIVLSDCSGQKQYFDNYLSSQADSIFTNVSIMIYVLDADELSKFDGDDVGACGQEWTEASTIEYFNNTIEKLLEKSSGAHIFCFLNKIDKISCDLRELTLGQLREKLCVQERCKVQIFGTSIWNDSLYSAWYSVLQTLFFNATILHEFLCKLRKSTGAIEVALFEKNTFLCFCKSNSDFDSLLVEELEINETCLGAGGERTTTTEVSKIVNRLCHVLKNRNESKNEKNEFKRFAFKSNDFCVIIDEFTKSTFILFVIDGYAPVGLDSLNIAAGRTQFMEALGYYPEIKKMIQ